ncbi:hypothetical protein CMUS01_13423 [Colletotrichum musicola]|uniref:Uncharacterized protein n=1 Tax=Colletotrichum musicola TaxID=2175873 RepID=A0A8H6MWB9_9PEZI|nr:hypothetical protein CMUS01_13423 [Colletotrichum musicola]
MRKTLGATRRRRTTHKGPSDPHSGRRSSIPQVTIDFESVPYGAKYISGIPFDIMGRTFRIAQAATRETWFVVMYPVTGEISELPRSTTDARQKREQGSERSGMPMPLARELASANIKIKTNLELYELPRERHCTTEEDDEGDDDDNDNDTNDKSGNPNRWDGDSNETL